MALVSSAPTEQTKDSTREGQEPSRLITRGPRPAECITNALRRTCPIRSHIDPVPERIARNLIKLLGLTREDYLEIMDGKKKVKKEKERYVVVKG